MSRSSADLTQLFRPLPHQSPVSRLWAGTKIVALAAVAVTLTAVPTWAGVGVIAGFLAAGLLAARVPRGAFPRPPAWFGIAIAFGGLLAVSGGGKPDVTIGGLHIGLGGVSEWARLLCLGIELVIASALLAWTTAPAELAPALARLGRPLRALRVPVDELATTIALAVRCLPVLLDESRTMLAARRLRATPGASPKDRRRELLRQPHDLLAAVLVVSVRRAAEMGAAIESRGGTTGVASAGGSRQRPGWRDAVAAVVVAAVCVAVVVVGG